MLDLADATRTVVAVPQPAAGSGFTLTVPESERQQLLAVSFRLVTSAVVATRTPILQVTDGTGIAIVTAVGGFGVTASLTVDYCFAVGLKEWDSVNTAASGPVPTVPLDAGDSIVLSVASVDSGDQLSRIRVTLAQCPVREYGDPAG